MRTTNEVHLQARVCAVKCYYKKDGNISEAMQAFEDDWNAQHPKHTVTDTRKFIQLSVKKLEKSFDLHDSGGQGRHKKLTDADAGVCADILAEGYMQQQVVLEA